MDIKSKKLGRNIVSWLVNIILFICIVVVLQITSFFHTYWGYESIYHNEDDFTISESYNRVVQNMIDTVFERQRTDKDTPDLSAWSSNVQVYAVDEHNKIVKGYSNVVKPWSPWDSVKGNDVAFSITRQQRTGSTSYHKYYHGSSLNANIKNIMEDYHFSLPYDIFDESGIETISFKFNYIEDTAELGLAYRDFLEFQKDKKILITIRLGAFILGSLIALFCMIATGKQEGALWWMDKIYTEIIILIGISAFAIFVQCFSSVMQFQSYSSYSYRYHGILQSIFTLENNLFSIINGLMWLIIFHIMLSLIRSLKCGKLFQRTLILKGMSKVINLFKNLLSQCMHIFRFKKLYNPTIVLAFLGYTFINLFIWHRAYASGSFLGFILWLIALVVVDIYALNELHSHLLSLKKLHDFSVNTCRSENVPKLKHDEITPMFQEFAQSLNDISQGRSVAVEKAIKNERLRSELITNVTHDLKNPLTSIISYSDLLKKEILENSTADEYIDVIYEKSLKLKDLIDHLVEASKVSSGVTEINSKPLDLVAMTKQLAGEYKEALDVRNLELILTHSHSPLMVSTDATYYARIFDNLFSNVIKYAMPHTRVYLEVDKVGDYPRLCLKNISENPLSMSEDELLERFTRGDKSRTKEGNGLGLSIAKSLALALKIELDVSVDGDLFKVCMVHLN